MLCGAKHLEAERERPFAAAQGDTGGKHLVTQRNRPFAAAQGDIVKCFRLMDFHPSRGKTMQICRGTGSPGGRNELRPYRSPGRMENEVDAYEGR
jgi:hypothetical protein